MGESTSTSQASAAVGGSDENLLKKPKLEHSIHSQQDGDENRDGGGIDNNNVSPVSSAFRPWNADEEGAADDRGGSESGGHNGDVAERKLDPYLMRGTASTRNVMLRHPHSPSHFQKYETAIRRTPTTSARSGLR